MKRALVVLALLLAPAAFAQTLEYGHDSAGTLDMTTKQSRQFDGSFSLSTGHGFGASIGGNVVKDRVWFFAAADRSSEIFRTAAAMTKSNITAALSTTRPGVSTAPQFNMTLPRDFLTLHSTALLSPSSFVTFDVQQTRH